MQCNKVLISTLDSSPKIALGAHKMAAQLQRRPLWLNTDCHKYKICHVICNSVALVLTRILLLIMLVERGHSWPHASLEVGTAAIRAAIMNLLACDLIICYPV